MTEQIRRRRVSLRLACFALLAAGLTSACGRGSETPTDPGGVPGIHVVAGGGQTDSVGVRLRDTLVVEVRDSNGRVAPGISVRFTAVVPLGAPYVYVAAPDQQVPAYSAVNVTDARGRAKALVELGRVAGSARLEVATPELGLADMVTFTIKPGSPTGFSLSPRDTSITPGNGYTLKAATTDRFGNPIPDAVPSFSATGVTISPTGQVAASAFVRGRIVVSYQGLSDSAKVSVVPLFPMVINRNGQVVLVNSDGTGATTLAWSTDASLAPSSVPTTTTVVFYEGDPTGNSKVMAVQPNGSPQPLLLGYPGGEAWPRLSPDGAWVYFVRNLGTLWRTHFNGSGLESVASFTPAREYSAPTVSPDGNSVAIEDGNGLKIIDVATKASRTVPVSCGYPAYSPDGAFFACASASDLSVMRTDGTGRRVVVSFPGNVGPKSVSGVDWSPDGKWLLTLVGQYATLYDVSTGAALPLPDVGSGAFVAGLGGMGVAQPAFVR